MPHDLIFLAKDLRYCEEITMIGQLSMQGLFLNLFLNNNGNGAAIAFLSEPSL